MKCDAVRTNAATDATSPFERSAIANRSENLSSGTRRHSRHSEYDAVNHDMSAYYRSSGGGGKSNVHQRARADSRNRKMMRIMIRRVGSYVRVLMRLRIQSWHWRCQWEFRCRPILRR